MLCLHYTTCILFICFHGWIIFLRHFVALICYECLFLSCFQVHHHKMGDLMSSLMLSSIEVLSKRSTTFDSLHSCKILTFSFLFFVKSKNVGYEVSNVTSQIVLSSHISLVLCLFSIIEIYIRGQFSTNFSKCFNYWIDFFKNSKQCVTKSIMQGRSPFLRSRKMGFKRIHSKN